MPFPDELRPVRVVDYRPTWPHEYALLAHRLWPAVAGLATAIDHVGSTSVPGLAAKDTIDIQIRVRVLDANAIEESLSRSCGVRRRSEPWNTEEVAGGRPSPKLVFAPPAGERSANVHVRLHGGAAARTALLFRDYLRAVPSQRDDWGRFKQRLCRDVDDLAAYGQVKGPAWAILMRAAEAWADAVGWAPGEDPPERTVSDRAWRPG